MVSTPQTTGTRINWSDVERQHKADEDGFTITVTNADGEPFTCPNPDGGDDLPFTITFAGHTSRQAAFGRRVAASKLVSLVERGDDGKVKLRTDQDAGVVIAQTDDAKLELYARRAKAWTLTNDTPNGVVSVPCTVENVQTFLLAQPQTVRRAEEADEQRRADFRAAGSTVSPVRDVVGDAERPLAGRGDVPKPSRQGRRKAAHGRRSKRTP